MTTTQPLLYFTHTLTHTHSHTRMHARTHVSTPPHTHTHTTNRNKNTVIFSKRVMLLLLFSLSTFFYERTEPLAINGPSVVISTEVLDAVRVESDHCARPD